VLCLARARNRRDAGFVLVSVLWILAILTVIALGFARRAMLERRMAWYALDHEQAQHMARAAAERGLFELRNTAALLQYDGQRNYIGLDQRWAREIDLFAEGYFVDIDMDEFAGDVCTVRIADDENRIPLNFAPRELLASLKSLSFSTIDKILDRRQVSTRGYQSALFLSVDELREMQPFTEEQWFGSQDKPGIRDLLCTDGDRNFGHININTAPEAVLKSLPNADARVVDQFMEYRNGPDGVPYTADDRALYTIMELRQKLNVSAEKLSFITAYCKTTSRFFTITGHASRRRGNVNAYCTVTVSLQGNRATILAWREDTHGA
jgi:type II secretory pathway component PulK